jgi:predicted GNAT family acetyltransferase
MSHTVTDNAASSRFELHEDGAVAFADYQLRGNLVVVPHVEAPMALRGTGAAGRLMEGMLTLIRERGQKISPLCPYAEVYIRRHPQWGDLVA